MLTYAHTIFIGAPDFTEVFSDRHREDAVILDVCEKKCLHLKVNLCSTIVGGNPL